MIKEFIERSPVLISLDYSKDYQIFSFATEDTITGVLLQKNHEGLKQPIAFMSKPLHSSKLKYTTMEKQSICLSQILEYFLTYVGYSKISGCIPHSAVKDILTQ